ncbi:MAG: NifB/NifX family molybdenum-iron cluster-binding protein [Deltaproteobacteria bacterium]|nr:NifB/NifX family molybdenum-iron cluster-binding protein [Deltaproteobacteria bacterium]
MKVAVSATGGSIQSEVEPRFGRAPYYVVVDTSNMKIELVFNSNTLNEHGVGPLTAKLIADTGAEVVLTGKVGPNAKQVLQAGGIRVVEDVTGTVRAAVDDFLQREGTNKT